MKVFVPVKVKCWPNLISRHFSLQVEMSDWLMQIKSSFGYATNVLLYLPDLWSALWIRHKNW